MPFLTAAAAPVSIPVDLTPWGMFASADIVVKLVIIVLVLASVLTWALYFAKSVELRGAQRTLDAAAARVDSAHSVEEAAKQIAPLGGAPADIAAALAAERRGSLALGASRTEGVEARATSHADRLLAGANRRMTAGVGVLGTISTAAPFLGLFGTVWGIMNSFIGIAESQTTNLAVVAPGIAEALLATALGLVAAIPAAVIYNHFSRAIGSWRAALGDYAAALLRLLSRELDSGAGR